MKVDIEKVIVQAFGRVSFLSLIAVPFLIWWSFCPVQVLYIILPASRRREEFRPDPYSYQIIGIVHRNFVERQIQSFQCSSCSHNSHTVANCGQVKQCRCGGGGGGVQSNDDDGYRALAVSECAMFYGLSNLRIYVLAMWNIVVVVVGVLLSVSLWGRIFSSVLLHIPTICALAFL